MRNPQSGQSMVLVGLLLVILIGMLALVLDGGYAYLQRRGAQTAADAGALAGARQLCRTGDTTLAIQAALDYAITRNRALEADVAIVDGEVQVTTRIPFPTFFGRVFGRASITASAIAAANCFPPGRATGILPIAWNCPPDETYTDADGNVNCDMLFYKPYIIMNSRKVGDEDTYCIDVLTQINSVSAALRSVAVGLLDEHVRHCVRDATEAGDAVTADRMVTEATKAIERLVRS